VVALIVLSCSACMVFMRSSICRIWLLMFMEETDCVAVALGVDAGAFASCANGIPATNTSAEPMAIATDLFM
jgi:hypothetical protein